VNLSSYPWDFDTRMSGRDGSDTKEEDDDSAVSGATGSSTPLRINSRNLHNDEPAGRSVASKRSRVVYGDRYIPNRNGINLQAAFSLVRDEVAAQPRKPNASELDYQRVDEANRTFSTLLKAELFGNDVPSAVPTATTASSGATSRGTSGSTTTTSDTQLGGHTPPHGSQSAPVTPNKNLFRYNSPSRQKSSTVTTGGRHGGRLLGGETANSQHEIYSISPVRMDSQRLLLSPRKQPRPVCKVPYKVLDAPELADDFYLNLVDWGSKDILGVGLGRCVYLWNAQSGSVNKLCSLEDDMVTSISWIKRGTHLAVGTSKGLVQIWDAERCKRVRQMTGHELRVGSLAWNDHILSSGSQDHSILHRDVRIADHYIQRLTGHRQEVCGLRWNPEENQLASGGNDNKLLIWEGLNADPLYKFNDHEAAVKAVAWSPHQRGLLASGGGTADRRIRFWNTLTGTALEEIDTGSQVCNLAWSKNSKELVSTHGYSQNQVMIWKYPSMQQVATLTGHTYRVLYLAMSPDGRTIVTGAGDETLRFWNIFDENRNRSRGNNSLLDVFQQLR
jgi:cell division cycle 20-like protein 1 (cofactor of APC complex)